MKYMRRGFNGNFEYAMCGTTDEEIILTGYIGKDKDVIVPSEIEGCAVTMLGDYLFYCNSHIKSIVLPDSITTIFDYCFGNCTKLKNINIPNGIEYIGNNIFDNCKKLNSKYKYDMV